MSEPCDCHKCTLIARVLMTTDELLSQRMILCRDCGNKRCPKASDHGLDCTRSNATGQKGSVYE